MKSLFPEFASAERQQALGQYMTPCWAAHALWEAFFPHATAADRVIEPTCGDGRMLAAVPAHIPAMGIEVDPVFAQRARARSGRKVIDGDFLKVDLPEDFTIAFGNPPFEAKFMDGMLAKLVNVCVPGAQCGFIAPAYFLQSPSRVLRWNRMWSLAVELLPRTIFPRLSKPLVFVLFTKDPVMRLIGLRLYAEAEAVSGVSEEAREELCERSGTWRVVVEQALRACGGKAHLGAIYERVKGRRPSANRYWQEKVRQTLQRHCRSHGKGVWELVPVREG